MTRTDIIQLEAGIATIAVMLEGTRKRISAEARESRDPVADEIAGMVADLTSKADELAAYLRDIREQA